MKPDKTSLTPLYIQIRDDIRRSVAIGELKSGDRLPPVTAMAEQLEVTAATIRRALQDLVSEGLVTSHVGRGTFIAGVAPAIGAATGTGARSSGGNTPSGDPDSAQASDGRTPRNSAMGDPRLNVPKNAREPTPEAVRAARRLRQSIADSLNDMMNLAHKPGVIAFTRGIGDPATIEEGILNRMAMKALAGGERVFMDYGDPRGLIGLRESIARLYAERGIAVSTDQILVTNGSQQAIALLAQSAADSGDAVICETPCYGGVTNAFSAFGHQVETLVRSDDGPDIAALPAHVRRENALLYVCPYLHNPTGGDLSAERAREIEEWARRYRATIVADEVFRDLRLDGDPSLPPAPPSFLTVCGPERAAVIGSLSKSFISGLRVGWIVTSPERVAALASIKKAMDLGCPPLMQGIAGAFLDDPAGYRAHRDRAREHYRVRRDATLAALERHMPDCVAWTVPSGGFQLQVSLPRGFSSVDLFLRCVERGAAFLPGPLQDINNRFMNTFRLCYGSLAPSDIDEGIARIAAATEEYLFASPGDSGMTGLGDF